MKRRLLRGLLTGAGYTVFYLVFIAVCLLTLGFCLNPHAFE